jgi:hypothetical protein
MPNWSRNPRRDMRPINAEGTAEGVRGASRGMRGELTGGYMPQADGSMKAFGTKQQGASGNALGGGLSRWERMNPNAKKPFSPGSPAAGGSRTARVAEPGPSPAASFAATAMPQPAVPSPMPNRPAGGALRKPARAVGDPMKMQGQPPSFGATRQVKMAPGQEHLHPDVKDYASMDAVGRMQAQGKKIARPRGWAMNPRG